MDVGAAREWIHGLELIEHIEEISQIEWALAHFAFHRLRVEEIAQVEKGVGVAVAGNGAGGTVDLHVMIFRWQQELNVVGEKKIGEYRTDDAKEFVFLDEHSRDGRHSQELDGQRCDGVLRFAVLEKEGVNEFGIIARVPDA